MKNKRINKLIKDFNSSNYWNHTNEYAAGKLEAFLQKYPFKKNPHLINMLTKKDIYNPGHKNYFSYWIEYKLKEICHIFIGSSATWENARNNLFLFKKLLRYAVNDKISIANKIDAEWETIKRFGGDKQTAKKIIVCFNYKKCIPVLNTKHLEMFVGHIGFDYKKEATRISKDYEQMSVGQKYEFLNILLMKFKKNNNVTNKWSNSLFSRFMYETFNPKNKVKKNTISNKIPRDVTAEDIDIPNYKRAKEMMYKKDMNKLMESSKNHQLLLTRILHLKRKNCLEKCSFLVYNIGMISREKEAPNG